VILTGGQSQVEVDNAFEEVFQTLSEFKDTTVKGSQPVEVSVGAR
jgi:hypothetical protein